MTAVGVRRDTGTGASTARWRAGLTVASAGHLGARRACELARLAEAEQYTSFWVGEASSIEAFTTLAGAASATTMVHLGTGVLPIELRTPPLVAMAAASLADLAGDRTVYLGLGVSSPAVVHRWHSAVYPARPVAQMKEFIEVLRACLSGQRVRHAGEFYRVEGFRLGMDLDPDRVKIIVAALNPQMLRLAGAVADGVILNHVPADQVPWAVDHVRRGGDADIYCHIHVGVCDRAANLDRARRELFPYMTVDGYARVFERAGYGDAVARVRSAAPGDERRAAVEAIPEDLITQLETMGEPHHVVAAIDRYVAHGVDHPIVFPLPYGPDPDATLQATVAAVGARHRHDAAARLPGPDAPAGEVVR